MKRTLTIMLVTVAALCIASIAFCQDPDGLPPPGPGVDGPGMSGNGGAPMPPPFGGPRGPGGFGIQAGGPPPNCPCAVTLPPAAPIFLGEQNLLGLTDEQREKYEALLTKFEESHRALMETARKACATLRKSLTSSDADEKKTEELANASTKAEAAVLASQLKFWKEIRTLITKEQLTKLSPYVARGFGGFGRQRMGGQQMGPPPGGGWGQPSGGRRGRGRGGSSATPAPDSVITDKTAPSESR